MIQELFRVGPVVISPFGVLLVAAFLAAYVQLARGLRRLGIGDADAASSLVVAGGLGGIVGAKVYYAILYGDPKLLLERYGLVWYGGFVLGAAAFLWTVRRRRMPLWDTLDAATPALALGYGIGRVGCFLVGDDYGRPTDSWVGIAFPNGQPPSTAGNLRRGFGVDIPPEIPDGQVMSVFPTQLFETGISLLIFFVLWRLRFRDRRPGWLFSLWLVLAGAERLFVEFFRAKDDRFFGALSLAQVLSIGLIGLGAWLMNRLGTGARETASK